MSTIPLRLDTDLVNEARSAATLFERSPTAQVEFWAKLGMVAEAVFSSSSIKRVKAPARVENLAEVLAQADTTEGRAQFAAEVRRQSVPLYRSVAAEPGVFIEKLPDGRERRGRFVNRTFTAFAGESKVGP